MTKVIIANLRGEHTIPGFLLQHTGNPQILGQVLPNLGQIDVTAKIIGKVGTAQIETIIEFDELSGLISELGQILDFSLDRIQWSTYSKSLVIKIQVDKKRFGPPIICDICISDMLANESYDMSMEEYRCIFETRLSWLDSFHNSLQAILAIYL